MPFLISKKVTPKLVKSQSWGGGASWIVIVGPTMVKSKSQKVPC